MGKSMWLTFLAHPEYHQLTAAHSIASMQMVTCNQSVSELLHRWDQQKGAESENKCSNKDSFRRG